MSHKVVSNKYKGIAIFGGPGTGKTTLARLLAARCRGSVYLESSKVVIYPAITLREKLPKTEGQFVAKMVAAFGKAHIQAPREVARSFFRYLSEKYTPTVVAKTTIVLHKKKFSNQFLVAAGLRGYQNANHFSQNGYLVVYLRTSGSQDLERTVKRDKLSKKAAEKERKEEEHTFSTTKIRNIADLVFDTAATNQGEICNQIEKSIKNIECKWCLNSNLNLTNPIGKSGLCDICEKYKANFNKGHLRKELKFLLSLRGKGQRKYDAMVGISGGKDSTATLYEVKRMGFTPLAFSLNTGYYPAHVFKRAKEIAKSLGVDHVEIDVRKYIRPVDKTCFRKTAELYDQKYSPALKEKFRQWYAEGRKHYSIKCSHAIPFVRTCQLCRRIIIRAYFGEALKYGVPAVILGINEWAGLSQNPRSKKFTFSATRKLRPFKSKPSVHVVHLPFLLQRKIQDTEKILKKIGWKVPKGENLVESNANSCLFARAAENKAKRLLGFHPDITRLSREVTVGFISKTQAKKALSKVHKFSNSVTAVLKRAQVLGKR